MRNLWLIMTKFNVLPTNDDFRKLTDDQLDLMLYSIEEDNREARLAEKGLTPDDEKIDTSFESEVWNKERDDWNVLKEGHDPDKIARQVDELTSEEDIDNLKSRFDGLEEYNDFIESGGKTPQESEIDQYIAKQIEIAEEQAKAKDEKKGKGLVDDQSDPDVEKQNVMSDEDKTSELNKGAMERAIQMFENNDDDSDNNDDDEFTEL